jgi:putative phosphoesterase
MADEESAPSAGGGGTEDTRLPAADEREPESTPQKEPASAPGTAPAKTRIGVISDTHGYLDASVLEIFAGVQHIIHAGDVVDPEILSELRRVAPLTAVAGNLDKGELAASLPREASGEVGGVRFVVAHKPGRLRKRLAAGKIDIPEGSKLDLIVWGHEHVPSASWVDGTLHLNPGTASSPEEEDDGPTVAIVQAELAGLAVCFIPLTRRPMEEAAEPGPASGTAG